MSGQARTTSHRTITLFTEYRTFLSSLVLAGWMHFYKCDYLIHFFLEILIAGITIQHMKKMCLRKFLVFFFYISSLMWFKWGTNLYFSSNTNIWSLVQLLSLLTNCLTRFMPRCVDRLLVAVFQEPVLFNHQNETRLSDFVLVSNRSSRKRDRFTVRPSDYISDSVTAPSSTATVPKR